MELDKEFIPYEQALALKELGFDKSCYAYYDGAGYVMIKEMVHCVISAPTYQQAFRWFREKYCLNSFIVDSKSYSWYFNINDMQTDDVISEVLYFKTYEEAELECLKKLIEIVKSGNQEAKRVLDISFSIKD